MMSLLIIRVIPLTLRPLAIFFEKSFLDGQVITVLIIAATGIASSLTSVPSYIHFYKNKKAKTTKTEIRDRYISSLFILIILGCTIAIVAGLFADPSMSLAYIILIAFSFILEKLADEICRYLEFNKKMVRWLHVQIIRNSWIIAAICLSILGFNYLVSCLVSCALAIFLLLFNIRTLISNTNVSFAQGWSEIKNNAIYCFGGYLSAVPRQFPKIFIIRMFPEYAHAYTIISQLSQSASLLHSIYFIIPRRKVISQKPWLYEKYIAKTHTLIAICLSITAVFFAISINFAENLIFNSLSGTVLLAVICSIEALLITWFGCYMEIILWINQPRLVTKTYFWQFLCSLIFLVLLYLGATQFSINVFSTLLCFTLLTSVLTFTVIGRHFTIKIHNMHVENHSSNRDNSR